MNEKQRADHADSRYKLLQSQNSQIEKVIFLISLKRTLTTRKINITPKSNSVTFNIFQILAK